MKKIIGMRTVEVGEIEENLFVRRAIDQDHVLYLAELIEAGVEMSDPIDVTITEAGKMMIIDGRHRKVAIELNGIIEVKVRVLSFGSEAEMIAYAYQANAGGSLPPTQGDTEHTIALLLDKGQAKKQISGLLNLPSSLAKKYISQVELRLKRAKLNQAKVAVLDGGTAVPKAAAQFGVDENELREALGGGKRQSKKAADIALIHRDLTSQFRSSSQRSARLIMKLFDQLDDGDVTPKQVEKVLDHLAKLVQQSASTLAGWRSRFTAKTNTKGSAT